MVNSFGKDIIPANDCERLKALHACRVLPCAEDLYFTNLTKIMARTLDMPIAIISLVDEDKVYCMASNETPPVPFTERGYSLCSLVVMGDEPLVFLNTLDHAFLHNNPFVLSDFHLRFYAGAPLITSDGYSIGTACVMDSRPRSFGPVELDLLTRFARAVITAIEKRKEIFESGCA